MLSFFSFSQDGFIKYLLEGTKNLKEDYAAENDIIISRIISCSTGILLLSLKKCDIYTNPNPTVSATATALSNRADLVVIIIIFSFYSLCLRVSLRSFV